MKEWIDSVDDELSRCTKCEECIKVCPVVEEGVTIQKLNQATRCGSAETQIERFAFRCVSCGWCIPVCPVGLNRLFMMVLLKNRLNKTPLKSKRYLWIRGNVNGLRRFNQVLFQFVHQREIRTGMKNNKKTKADVLLYLGCYVHSPEIVEKTKRILQALGLKYEVLQGLESCCGIPQFLQGNLADAENCFKNLSEELKKRKPKLIVSGCMECIDALRVCVKSLGLNCQIKSIAILAAENPDVFTKTPAYNKILFAPSCKLRKAPDQLKSVERLLQGCTDSLESIEKWCCGKWSHGYEKSDKKVQYGLEEAMTRVQPDVVVCDCLTCSETVNNSKPGSVIDIVDLLAKTLENDEI